MADSSAVESTGTDIMEAVDGPGVEPTLAETGETASPETGAEADASIETADPNQATAGEEADPLAEAERLFTSKRRCFTE